MYMKTKIIAIAISIFSTQASAPVSNFDYCMQRISDITDVIEDNRMEFCENGQIDEADIQAFREANI
jgi:hypothetical protein